MLLKEISECDDDDDNLPFLFVKVLKYESQYIDLSTPRHLCSAPYYQKSDCKNIYQAGDTIYCGTQSDELCKTTFESTIVKDIVLVNKKTEEVISAFERFWSNETGILLLFKVQERGVYSFNAVVSDTLPSYLSKRQQVIVRKIVKEHAYDVIVK